MLHLQNRDVSVEPFPSFSIRVSGLWPHRGLRSSRFSIFPSLLLPHEGTVVITLRTLMCSFDLFWQGIHLNLLDGNYLSSAQINDWAAAPRIITVLQNQRNERRSVC